MALTERQKEQQILIRAMHSPYFTKQVLSKDVGALITTPILKEIANVVVRYYGTTDELLTLDTLNTKLEQRLIRRARVNKEEINEASIDKLFQIDSVLINSKEDNNETLLSDLESYIHTQLANEAILEEANAGSKNISERVAKRLDDINAIKLTGTKYEIQMSSTYNYWQALSFLYVNAILADNDYDTLDRSYEAIKGIMVLPWNATQLDKWNTLLSIIQNFR